MRHWALALGLATAAVLAGCSAQAARVPLVGPEVLAKAGLKYYWNFQQKLEPGESMVRLWRMDENLYALTDRNRLLAIDAVRGLYKWSAPVAPIEQKVFPPCHADNVLVPEKTGIADLLDPAPREQFTPFNAVIINTLSCALMINRDTGRVVRRMDLKFAANTGGSSDGTYFYVADVGGRYHAVRLSEGLVQWSQRTDDMISVRPQVVSRRLFVASYDQTFYAVSPEASRDRTIWSYKTDGALTADFHVDARGCFVPSQDYNLYAVDALTGANLWTFRAQGPLMSGVQVGPKSCFQYADNDRFYAIDIANGRKRWDSQEARLVLAADETFAYVLTADRKLLKINELTGQAETNLPMNGLDLFVGNAAKPVLYAATAGGKLVCIRPEAAPALTEAMLKDRPEK